MTKRLIEELEREIALLRADRDYWHKLYVEAVRPAAKQDGIWPNWGDSPNGFDGPQGAN